ncbi:MAG: FAD-binding protein [Thermodesulfobacteriota bacterium]
MVRHDVVIIGGGLAGMRAAIEISDAGLDCAIVSKVHPVRSHSVAAQGGINAVLKADDSSDAHAFDTVKGSDYLADQDAVDVLCKEGPGCIEELEAMGAVFSRDDQGRIAQRPFGGAGYPRTCYLADRTGHGLVHLLYEQILKRNICVYSEWHVLEITTKNNSIRGVVALELSTGRLHRLSAKAVVVATGGYGRVFSSTTNAISSTGDGMSLALSAGAPLMDMEFVQFHPTTLKRTGILITEAARGEGGYLVNSLGERFMKHYAPEKLELASRDVVSRAEQKEITEGRGVDGCVLLDLRHLGEEKINEVLPQIRELSIKFAGVDPVKEPIPVRPGAHYSMGGIMTDVNGKTTVEGLWSAGESACVSVHGANRLGGNSLLEAIVFGKRTGKDVSRFCLEGGGTPDFPEDALKECAADIAALFKRQKGESAYKITEEAGLVMSENCGIFRKEETLSIGLKKIRELRERHKGICLTDRGDVFNTELQAALELGCMLELSEVILLSAISRQESRGSHWRLDYPERDDLRWLKHTVARRSGKGYSIEHKGVNITRWKPVARTY